MPFSAKGLLNDAQITLEKAATDKFGAVVDDFVRGGLGGLIPPEPTTQQPVNRNDGSWYATSYAAALAGGTSYRPKLKFLFKVEFIFTDEAKALYPELAQRTANDFTFMIKQVDRPKIDFEYEEDVNMYNFRTKVLKKIRHRDLTIVFMDDIGNRVFDFFRILMQIHSPITRRQRERDYSIIPPSSKSITNGSGMNFSGTDQDIAHRAVVNSTFGNSIEAIRIKQIFVDPSEPLATATKMVSFDFLNPRIMSFDLDELSHEANDVNLLTMIFDYDWMEMVNVGALGTTNTPFTSEFENVVAPGVHGAPSDIHPNSVNGAVGRPQGDGRNTGLAGALSNILGRGAAQITSDAIGKAVKSVGGGRFATAIGGVASSALSGPIKGLVSGAARDIMAGGVSNTTSTTARATTTVVKDRSSTKVPPAIILHSSESYVPANPAIGPQ